MKIKLKEKSMHQK